MISLALIALFAVFGKLDRIGLELGVTFIIPETVVEFWAHVTIYGT